MLLVLQHTVQSKLCMLKILKGQQQYGTYLKFSWGGGGGQNLNSFETRTTDVQYKPELFVTCLIPCLISEVTFLMLSALSHDQQAQFISMGNLQDYREVKSSV